MRILDLTLKNIGPFDEAHVEFGDPADPAAPSVTFFTGENGTGKSILIDAIRAIFGPSYGKLKRNIYRARKPIEIIISVSDTGRMYETSINKADSIPYYPGFYDFRAIPAEIKDGAASGQWVTDYWDSNISSEDLKTQELTIINHRYFLFGSLSGAQANYNVTSLICHFDYLRDSRDPQEKELGEKLWAATERIVAASMQNGRLTHVARSRLEPMFEHHGQQIGIEKLSAGSLYLIQRMLGLLQRMYSCYVLSDKKTPLLEIPGLLLIDEAENHLHPKWQKRFLPTIQQVFPNIQIVVATHSPFILASIEGARVYVCRDEGTSCTVNEVTDHYASRPIDEILLSPAFAETQPFNAEITALLRERKEAIQRGDAAEQERIEQELQRINPDYFEYFGVEDLLRQVAGGT